ncbi:hypothetical protein [Melaminivora sp.]|uniref:hypothetical protein n=1 Tax=Melaminivora sp. TaxID=1933032 RepID=UPI0028B1E059|nr:hypothetical protein [Melaminivora sp.]
MIRFLALPLAATLVVLSGCASRQSLVPDVQRQEAAGGVRTVSVAPERLACTGGTRCPVLAASWTSEKKSQAVLGIGLPGQAAVTGADVHVGGSEVVRLRVPLATPGAGMAQPPGYALTGFDVPLRLVDQIAHGTRTWMRVYTANGMQVDESIFSGEERSRASEAMAQFLGAVQAAGGEGVGLQGSRGGLLEQFGGGAK